VLYSPTGRFNLPRSYGVDSALAIYLYTLHDPGIYAVMNREMFNPDRRTKKEGAASSDISAGLRAFLPYIKFLLHALETLPAEYIFKGEVRRGVKWVYPSPDEHNPRAHFAVLIFFELF